MKSQKSVKQLLIVCAVSILCTACKTLHPKISHEQMLETTSSNVKELLEFSEYENCHGSGSKVFGEVTLKNNLWGKSKLKRGTASLCTYKKGDYWGWQWKIHNSASGVIGYPALSIGRSPWGSATRPREGKFPILVSEIESFEVAYNFETTVKHRKFNLAFDIWVSDIEFASKDNIKTEIMIWEDYFDFKSYGKIIEKITTPFGDYKVHVGHLKNDKFSQDWQYVAFVRETPRTSGQVNVNYLLHYLVSNNIIPKEHYICSLELGNEIGNSSGVTLVRKFDWNLKTIE